MIGHGPDISFTKSKYFDPIDPREAVSDALTLRLKPGASDKDKRELEEYVNFGGIKDAIPHDAPERRFKHPYWTWDGRIVEKSSLPKDYPYSKGWRGIWQKFHKEQGW